MTAADRDDPCALDAVGLAGELAAGERSAREVLRAHLDRIDQVDTVVNAMATVDAEQAYATATALDEAFAAGRGPVGPLHGLPFGVKDLHLTRGLRTTFGSPIHADFVPDIDALVVERVRRAGAVLVGKTNVPEFGAGSHTYNPVFGTTRNPWDPSRSAGGSSGGSAAALACGMVALADGSDLGGSLRNPASFCNVVGLRPSPGRVPRFPAYAAWDTLPVLGPMGRTVPDVALLLSVLAGPDPRDPLSIEQPGSLFAPDRVGDAVEGLRVAWSTDLGFLPVEPAVAECVRRGVADFAAIGCEVVETHPDLRGAFEVFLTLRAHLFAGELGEELDRNRAQLKDDVIWNVEQGYALDARTVARAEAQRTVLYHRCRAFLDEYDALVLPAAQVVPFDADLQWPAEVAGTPMRHYLEWMAICCVVTLTGLPVASVPCGFTPDGLPVGVQIVGRHHGERELLRLAHAFEQAGGHTGRRPPRSG